MAKLNGYGLNNIYWILVSLLLFGCGFTPDTLGKRAELWNENSISLRTSEFKITKLNSRMGFDQLPKELAGYQHQMGQFDFYLAQSPTQPSGGFIFQIIENSDPLMVCLKKPEPQSAVTAALTNPIALIRVRKGLSVEMRLRYCDP